MFDSSPIRWYALSRASITDGRYVVVAFDRSYLLYDGASFVGRFSSMKVVQEVTS